MREEKVALKQEIAAIWDQCGEVYDNDYAHGLKSPGEKQAWLDLLDSLVDKKPSDILDVGAGTGFLSLLFCELGHRCKGIDLLEGMLAQARKKAEAQGVTPVFAIGDAENLKEPDAVYDVVVNRHLVWTLPHPEQAVREWLRVLKPGGKLIVIDGDWYYDSLKNKIKVFLGKCIISLTERRNAFAGVGTYDDALVAKLPMMKSENAKQLVALVEGMGIAVETRSATQIELAEKRVMSLGYRLKNPYKRTVIVGTKS